MPKEPNDLILIGFGKHSLHDMLKWRDDPEKAVKLIKAPTEWPPHYRRIGACSQEQIETCMEYVNWLVEVLNTLEEKNES